MKAKGVSLVYVKKELRAKGLDNELQAQLTPEEQKTYRTSLPVSYVSSDFAEKIYLLAGKLLYPDHPQPGRELSRHLAKDNLLGIYKILFRFFTIPFIINQVAKVWKVYNDTGIASAEGIKDKKEIVFILREVPELGEEFREQLCGYIQGMMELSGAQNIQVRKESSDPQTWRWFCTWE